MKKMFALLFFVLLSVAFMGQSAQDMTVRFIGKLNGNHYQRLDSVRFTNLTRGWSETIIYPDTIIVLNATVDVLDNEFKTGGFEQNVPNPFDCHTMVELSVPQDENVRLQLFDAAGKQCAELKVSLEAGSHRFDITASKPQTYILKAIAGEHPYSVRMVNVGSCGCDGIKYGGYAGLSTKLTIENEFQVGDDMEFVGYANIDGVVVESEVVTQSLMENLDVVLVFSRLLTDFNMEDGFSVNINCGVIYNFYDSGGADGCYSNNEDMTAVFTSDGRMITLTFSEFETEPSFDKLTVYDGTNLLGVYYGTTIPAAVTASSDTMVVVWHSDYSSVRNGWSAIVTANCMRIFTCEADSISNRGATIVGNIISDDEFFEDNDSIVVRGFVYGICEDNLSMEAQCDCGIGNYTASITELMENTMYYYRAYMVWANDTVFGEVMSFTTMGSMVHTNEATDVYVAIATLSGSVIAPDDSIINRRGFLYGTDSCNLPHDIYCGTGIGVYAHELIGLQLGTTYYYRAYAVNDDYTSYGELMSFTTRSTYNEPTGYIDGYAYVDLGLPSGTLWATCNVGANVPEEYGDYYAWGETSTKETFDWSNYSWCNGSRTTLTKYCSDSNCGDNGYTDTLTTLEPSDDVATVIWGNNWRMPTDDELAELVNGCQYTFMTQNGVKGYLAIGPNGNSIFIPAAGHISENGLINATYNCNLWSSTLYVAYPHAARTAFFTSYGSSSSSIYRNCGAPIRPVCSNSGGQISMPDTVVVSFNANGGNGTMDSQIYSVGTLQALHVNGFIREGYVFSGWSTFANGYGTSYSDQQEISIRSNITLYAQWITLPTGDLNGHDYVDLGLPSGTKWATCNVGADSPTDYGNYYAWGELTTKGTYSWSNYIYCNGSQNRLTKYCNNSNYGDNGFVDTLITLQVLDDVATDNWGSGWRMPTNDDFNELLSNCTYMVSIQNGVKGMLFIGPNGKSIFLPPGGYRDNNLLFNLKRNALYWSSSLCENVTYCAFYLRFCTDLTSSNIPEISAFSRESGFSVRPVCNPSR